MADLRFAVPVGTLFPFQPGLHGSVLRIHRQHGTSVRTFVLWGADSFRQDREDRRRLHNYAPLLTEVDGADRSG